MMLSMRVLYQKRRRIQEEGREIRELFCDYPAIQFPIPYRSRNIFHPFVAGMRAASRLERIRDLKRSTLTFSENLHSVDFCGICYPVIDREDANCVCLCFFHASIVPRKWQDVNPSGCDCREIPEKTSRADSRSCRTHDPPRDRSTTVRRSP